MKKVIIGILTFLFIVSNVYANSQIAIEQLKVDDVSFIVNTDYVTLKKTISPMLTISFKDPVSWASDGEEHEPDYYNLDVRNITSGKNTNIKIYKGSVEYTEKIIALHNKMKIDTGSLYEIEITPFHIHRKVDAEGKVTEEEAPYISPRKYVYALTDIAATYETRANSIDVKFDDIAVQGVKYKIMYALGNYDNKDDVIDNIDGQVIVSKDSNEVSSYIDSGTGRQMLKLSLDSNLVPGQTYSVFVEPMIDNYNGKSISRNRLFPNISKVTTEIKLELEKDGEYIKLLWEIPSTYQVEDETANLEEIRVVEIDEGNKKPIAIFNGSSGVIGYYKMKSPDYGKSYQLFVKYSNQENYTQSNKVAYNPSSAYIVPSKPYIPEFLSKKSFDMIMPNYSSNDSIEDSLDTINILKDKYFVKDYSLTTPINQVIQNNDVFRIADNGGVNIVWGAFKRRDINELSPTYGKIIYDNNVSYDIYISDSYGSLEYVKPVIQDFKTSSTTSENVILDGDNIIGYRYNFQSYYDIDGGMKAISPNKLYYVKVVPKKQDLIGAHSIVAFYYDYNGASFMPPSLSNPPFMIDEVSENSIGIKFRNKWYEVMAKNASEDSILSKWQTRLFIDEGELKEKGVNAYNIYDSKIEVERFKEAMSHVDADLEIIDREISFGENSEGIIDSKYKFLCVKYDEVENKIAHMKNEDATYDFEKYMSDLTKALKDGTSEYKYVEINPVVDGDELKYTQGGLLPNSKYLLLLNVYRELPSGEIVEMFIPSVLLASTLPENIEINPNPEVPNLYASSASSTSINLQFKYNTDFTYEIIYSKKDDKTDVKKVEIKKPTDDFVNGSYYEISVDGLFPNTTYYFWLKAIGKDVESNYSNTTSKKTLDVDAPTPPRRLGLASSFMLDKYGFQRSLDKDMVVLEWMLDNFDISNEDESAVKKEYSYRIEISENKKFVGAKVFTSPNSAPSGGNIHEKNVISLEGLSPNRKYYVRGKTILTISGEEGKIVRESQYTHFFILLTLPDENEYDRNVDLEALLLPDSDYEQSYDSKNKKVYYRFRDGNKGDRIVSERLISQIVMNDLGVVNVDFKSSNDKIMDYMIEIPDFLYRTFSKRGVDLKIRTKDGELIFPSGFADSYFNKYGNGDNKNSVVIELKKDFLAYNKFSYGLNAYRAPLNLGVYLKGESKRKNLRYFDKDVSVSFDKGAYDKYVYKMQEYVDKAKPIEVICGKTSFTAKIKQPAILQAYRVNDFRYAQSYYNKTHWSRKYLEDIKKKYDIKGMTSYIPESFASHKNVVNSIFAVLDNALEIDFEKNLKRADINTLIRSGILNGNKLSDGTISKKDALEMFVKAYEIKYGNESNGDLVKKAHDYGLISSVNNFKAYDAIKRSEMITILSRLIKKDLY